jgi:hypothetical protein
MCSLSKRGQEQAISGRFAGKMHDNMRLVYHPTKNPKVSLSDQAINAFFTLHK